MAVQMRQFFTAGGDDAVVVRAATGAVSADLILSSESGGPVLIITALVGGMIGDQIRAVIDFDTPDPELSFNMTL